MENKKYATDDFGLKSTDCQLFPAKAILSLIDRRLATGTWGFIVCKSNGSMNVLSPANGFYDNDTYRAFLRITRGG